MKILNMAILVLAALLLVSCAPEEPAFETHEYASVCGDGVCSAGETGKCDVDCQAETSAPYKEQKEAVLPEPHDYSPENTDEEGVAENDQMIITESYTSYLPQTGFRVAAGYNLLNIGENISRFGFELGKYHLREILRSGRLSSNTEAFGPRAGFYEQYLWLRNGRTVFGYEPESESISSYLLFEQDQPVLEYNLVLQGGIFKFFEGESINLLGHEYIIKEVGADYIRLQGLNTHDNIMLRDQGGALINDKRISNAGLNISLQDNHLWAVVIAYDELRLLPGQSLRNEMQMPERLLTNRIDVEYNGLTKAPEFSIEFKEANDQYRLLFVNNKNMSYNIPLFDLDTLKLGDEKYGLVVKEGDCNIKEKDYFVLTNKNAGFSHVLRLLSIKHDDNLLVFEDPALEEFVIYFKDDSAELVLNNLRHRIAVGEECISADLDGNNRIAEDEVEIITAGNAIVRISEPESGILGLSVVTPGYMRENSQKELKTGIEISREGVGISQELEMHSYQEFLLGMNDYGALFVLEDVNDEEEQRGEELIIKYPAYQRFADVIVKGYE